MASGESGDFLCSPSKSWLERYEELADRSYPGVVIEDVVEPYRQPLTSTPHRNGTDPKGVKFDFDENQRSRSPIHGYAYNTLDDMEVNNITDNTRRNAPKLDVVDDIVQRYTNRNLPGGGSHSTEINCKTPPPSVRSQMTYSPYRGPIQDEIHTQPYYGPIVNTIRTDFNEPDPKLKFPSGSGSVSAIINKVHNKVSEERIEELSNKYRERMDRKNKRQIKHHRSKSDNAAGDLDVSSRSKGHKGDDWILKKYENAVLQIEKLESQIKCLKMEVNSLTASKKQAEMRVSHFL